jgi:hypothetical protein
MSFPRWVLTSAGVRGPTVDCDGSPIGVAGSGPTCPGAAATDLPEQSQPRQYR